jgi:hypothetical protein
MCLPALAVVGTAMGASAASAAAVGTLATMTAVSGVVGAAGAYQSASAQKNAAKAQAQIAANNAQSAEWQAQDAKKRGDEAVADQNRKNDQMLGSQKAVLAGRGVALDSGSPLSMLEDTQVFGGIDVGTIRNNANRAAWGFQAQRSDALATSSMYTSQAKQINPAMSAGTSLLNSGTQLASMWMKGGAA